MKRPHVDEATATFIVYPPPMCRVEFDAPGWVSVAPAWRGLERGDLELALMAWEFCAPHSMTDYDGDDIRGIVAHVVDPDDPEWWSMACVAC